MIRLSTLVVGVVVVVAAAVTLGVARSGERMQASVLHFYDKPGKTTVVDNAPKGKTRSAGDILVFTNPVFTRHGGRVGTESGTCTVIRAKPFMAQCTATLQIPGGQLMLQNVDTRASSYSVAVIGGTDEFSGANGLLASRSSGKSTTLDITLK
jgi:hypothetical protein